MSIYETVLEANLAALDKTREGVRGVDVHAATSEVIEKAWLGEYSIHGLGHGVEPEVHEGPNLGKTSKDTIIANNVVTDETSIYIHGFGGVRIEDTVLVIKSEPERLTKAPKVLDAMLV